MDVLVTTELNSSADAVWALVGDFGNLPAWSPAVRGCTVDGTGVGSHRTILTANGEVRERLEAWEPERWHLAYAPVSGSALPVRGLKASISLLPAGAQRTRLNWRLEGEPLRPQAEVEQLLRTRYAARLDDLRDALARQAGVA
jgi:hypothetical protein